MNAVFVPVGQGDDLAGPVADVALSRMDYASEVTCRLVNDTAC